AGGLPDPAFPSDGIDIHPAIGGRALPERTLFWRFANHTQRAARRGRFKLLEIAGNAFLFDVVADPMERANLRAREPSVFAALAEAWDAWNAGMLPPDPAAGRHGFSGRHLAEYFGVDS
ncbi:MAG TPA: twin-arginine translocation pathway signal protein, partial [Croceibacterium sp.]|nr:twin-arginine translocation pathway signal protein [Croceibacterium sp.]